MSWITWPTPRHTLVRFLVQTATVRVRYPAKITGPLTGQFHKPQLQSQNSQCFQITLQSAFSKQCKLVPESLVLWQSLHHTTLCWCQRQQLSLWFGLQRSQCCMLHATTPGKGRKAAAAYECSKYHFRPSPPYPHLTYVSSDNALKWDFMFSQCHCW